MFTKRKALLICFLVLTAFSMSVLSYTLYLIFETERTVHLMEVDLTDVKVNEITFKGNFSLVITNPSRLEYEIFYYTMKIYFNNKTVGTKEESYELSPFRLPSNAKTNLTITLIPLNNQTSYSNGVWRIKLDMILVTPLPQHTGVNREITHVEE